MGINWKIRFKNPLFWMSLFGVISCTLGIEPDELKTWAMVLEEIKYIIGNPFLLVSTIMAIAGVVVDPTTKGVCDSKRALRYTSLHTEHSHFDDSDFEQ